MSAYVVSRSTIDALVALAVEGPADRGPRYPGNGWYGPNIGGGSAHGPDADAIGQALVDECVDSVAYRYSDDTRDTLPGPCARYYNDGPYTWHHPYRVPTILEGLFLIGHYEYQSCEHPGWDASAVRRWCESLRDSLVSALPGYGDGLWGWPDSAADERQIRAR